MMTRIRDDNNWKWRLMRRAALILSCMCLLFAGSGACAAGGTPEEAAPGAAEGPENGQHPVSSVAFLREWIEEDNRMNEEAERQGFHPVKQTLFLAFTEDGGAGEPVETVASEDGGIHGTVVARIEDPETDASDLFSMTAVLLLNGRPVDFSLEGNGSQEGVLSLPLNSNRDYIMTLRAGTLPVSAGENRLILIMFGYRGDQDFYLGPTYTKGSFLSDREYAGVSVAPCPEDQIDTVVIQNRSELQPYAENPFLSAGEMTDFQADHYGNYLMTSKPNPTMHFYLDNMSIPGMLSGSRGILFMLIDGELKPVWNGCRFGEMSVGDGDLLRVIRVESGFGSGEEHHIFWCYQETEGAEEWPVTQTFRMKMKMMD